MGKVKIPNIPRPKKNKDNSSAMFKYIGSGDDQYSVGDFIIAIEHYAKSIVYGEIVKISEPEKNYIIFHIKPAEISPNGQKIDVGDTILKITSTGYTFMKTTKKDYIDGVKTNLEDNIKKAKENIKKLHKDINTYQKNLREVKKIK